MTENNEYKFDFNSNFQLDCEFYDMKSYQYQVEDDCNPFNVDSSQHGSTLAQSCGCQEEKSNQSTTVYNLSEDLDQVPFDGKIPDLNVLATIVRSQIDERGIDFVVDK